MKPQEIVSLFKEKENFRNIDLDDDYLDLGEPLNRAQERLWQIETIAESKTKPNEVLCCHVQGEFSVEHLVAGIRNLLKTNHQYRSVLAIVNGSPVWRIDDAVGISIKTAQLELGSGG